MYALLITFTSGYNNREIIEIDQDFTKLESNLDCLFLLTTAKVRPHSCKTLALYKSCNYLLNYLVYSVTTK